MSMTKNEAEERARKIWGQAPIFRTVQVSQKRDGWTADVTVSVGRRNQTHAHFLDGNGHTDCHPECALLEAAAYPPPAVDAVQNTTYGARCCRFELKAMNDRIVMFTITQAGADDQPEVYTLTRADLIALIGLATSTLANLR